LGGLVRPDPAVVACAAGDRCKGCGHALAIGSLASCT
jgi:hypothetical protein